MQRFLPTVRRALSRRALGAALVGSIGVHEFIEHPRLICAITAPGGRTTLYPASLRPGDIAHDAALLPAR